MSTTRKIAHNTMIQLGGKVISTVFGLLAIAMMTRYLGQEQFGWYITTISFLGSIGILIDFGLTPVSAQMLSEPDIDHNRLLKNLLGYRLVTAVIFLGIAPLIALSFPYPYEVKVAIAFSTISFLATALNQVLVGYYQTKLKMHIQVLGEVAGRIVLVSGLWFFITNGYGFLPIMGVLVASSVSYTTVLWYVAKKSVPIGFDWDMAVWKRITHTMWPIALSIIFNVVYLKGDTILLSLFRPQTDVGIYGAAYRVIDILTQTAMMLMGVMLPLLAYHWTRKDTEHFRKFYQQSFDLLMLVAIPMTVGILILAEPIIVFVAGAEFASAAVPLRILALAILGVYAGAIAGHTIVAIGKQRQTVWIFLSAAILTLIGYLYTIPLYGMFGAAWMTVASEVYVGALLFLSIQRYTQIRLTLNTFAKICFSAFVMGAVVLQLPPMHVTIQSLIGVFAYFFFIVALRVVSPQTIRTILSRS